MRIFSYLCRVKYRKVFVYVDYSNNTENWGEWRSIFVYNKRT